MKRVLAIMFILVLIPAVAYSQDQFGKFNLFGGIAMPRGDFADDDMEDEDSGLAKTGFGIGINHTRELTSPELTWMSSVTLLINGYDLDEDEFGEDVDVEMGRWMNIPVMTGLRYETSISPTMKIYGFGQAGFNFAKAPNVEVKGEVYY